VSEFLIYLGSFRGIAPKSPLLAFSVLAIIGLAIIGALALACFTKVVGVVFQGEPRSRAAQAATGENSPAMLLPMLILAAACILIGVWPGAFMFMPIKAMAALGLSGGRIPLASFTRISNHITLAAAVFLGMLLVALALRRSAYQGKVIGQSGTWGCGFTRPTPRMQYTGSSFAASILGFFRPAAPLLEDHPPVSGLFPKPTHYHSHILDIVELHLNRIIVRPVRALFAKLRWIQHGDIHLYIGYIFMTIVVLLFFV
jgi:hydrogenase-4 component B